MVLPEIRELPQRKREIHAELGMIAARGKMPPDESNDRAAAEAMIGRRWVQIDRDGDFTLTASGTEAWRLLKPNGGRPFDPPGQG